MCAKQLYETTLRSRVLRDGVLKAHAALEETLISTLQDGLLNDWPR